MTDHTPNPRLLELLGEDVEYDVQGPNGEFEIYDDGDFMITKEGDTYTVYRVGIQDAEGHTGQPDELIETEDIDEVVEELSD